MPNTSQIKVLSQYTLWLLPTVKNRGQKNCFLSVNCTFFLEHWIWIQPMVSRHYGHLTSVVWLPLSLIREDLRKLFDSLNKWKNELKQNGILVDGKHYRVKFKGTIFLYMNWQLVTCVELMKTMAHKIELISCICLRDFWLQWCVYQSCLNFKILSVECWGGRGEGGGREVVSYTG